MFANEMFHLILHLLANVAVSRLCQILLFFDPRYSVSEGAQKLTKQYKGGYDRQSVQSAAGKLSCNKTALKRCTKTEIL